MKWIACPLRPCISNDSTNRYAHAVIKIVLNKSVPIS